MNVTGNIECWSTAVADGARLLDQENEGWWVNINLYTLDINSPFSCVLGQLYGSYSEGRQALGIESGEGDIYGFDCNSGQHTFDTLNELWGYLITARRETAA